MLIYLLAVSAGCFGLYLGGDFLLKGATSIGRALGLSAAVIGFVLISLGTSAPELFVSAGAALQGYGDVAAGNVVGSNIVNIGIVLGLGAIILPLSINSSIRIHQMPLMVALTVLGFVFLLDGQISRLEGGLLLIAAILSVWWAMRVDVVPELDSMIDESTEKQETMSAWKSGLLVVGGILLLVAGAEGLIWGGVGLANVFGIPEAVIALTVTSIGTGLPEITATVLDVIRKETDMAVGNVVGSNLLNIGLVLGMSGLITPINSDGIGMLPLGVMIVLTVILAALSWWPRQINRWIGAGFLTLFFAYTAILVR